MKPTKTTLDARDRLLETADRLFYAEGIRAVGIDRVIAEANVAKATLYAHFPSKDDLILAVLQYREAKVDAFFSEATARHRKRIKDPLRAFFAALKDWFRSPGFRGCAFQNAAVELANPDHHGTAFVRSHKKRFHETLAGLVRKAVGKAGESIIPAIAVLVEGAIVTALIDRPPPQTWPVMPPPGSWLRSNRYEFLFRVRLDRPVCIISRQVDVCHVGGSPAQPIRSPIMTRINPVDHLSAQGRTRELLDAVKAKLGIVPNMTRTMAVSPAVLEAYLGISGALGHGVIPAKVREQLALDVGEANHCDYCVSAHTAAGKRFGLSDDELQANRRGGSTDPKTDVLLRFARTMLTKQGMVEDSDIATVRQAGFGDAEIAEIVAHVALNVFTNYFNNVARTTIDFPKAPALTA